jgi:hypothetical protein
MLRIKFPERRVFLQWIKQLKIRACEIHGKAMYSVPVVFFDISYNRGIGKRAQGSRQQVNEQVK